MKLGRRWVGIVLAESGAGRGRVQPLAGSRLSVATHLDRRCDRDSQPLDSSQ
jgi:hypothetical protein